MSDPWNDDASEGDDWTESDEPNESDAEDDFEDPEALDLDASWDDEPDE